MLEKKNKSKRQFLENEKLTRSFVVKIETVKHIGSLKY